MTELALKFYQEVGRDFLARKTRALLADEMRLGKTAQALTACVQINAQRVLIICPAIARRVWQDEAEKWAPSMSNKITVKSYDYARANVAKLTMLTWDVLILDECHFLKSTDAKRTSAILGKGGLGWYAKRIWWLSGTPAPNHAGELWPTFRAAGVIKTTYYDFINYFCDTNPEGKPIGTKMSRVPELRKILDGFMLRRRKEQVATELPKCQVDTYPVESSDEFLDLIRPVDGKKLKVAAGTLEKQLKKALAEMPARKHADYLAGHIEEYATLRRITGILKTPKVYDTVRFEIENELIDKLVIFAYHREPLHLLHRLLNDEAGIKTELIYGGTPEKKRDAALGRFRRDSKKGGSRVLVAQIQAAGTAIDLSVAHQGILLERDWVPGNNAQALERMGGYNQTRPISIRDIVIPDSIDCVVAATLARKMRELSSIFD